MPAFTLDERSPWGTRTAFEKQSENTVMLFVSSFYSVKWKIILTGNFKC